MIVMLPGTGRTLPELRHWQALIPGLEIPPLPGLGGPQLPSYTVEAMAEHFAGTLAPGSLVVGESLGGLVALALGGLGFRSVAFDPPLSMAKQWSVIMGLRRIQARAAPDHPIHQIAADAFGAMPDGSQEERLYYPLLERLKAPADVVTGTVPLWPYGHAFNRACALDDVDRWVLARFPLVTLHIVEGPHALLSESVEACRDVILKAAQAGGVRAA